MALLRCRRTALHRASRYGKTETAIALVKEGADVHCQDNGGYGSRAASSYRLVSHSVVADGPCTRGRSGRSACLGCAGGRRCTGRRAMATRRQRWRWSRRAQTCTARTTTGNGSGGCVLVLLVCHKCGADGTSTPDGAARRACFGCAGIRRCTMHRRTATRRRRWRWSRRARTCTAKPSTGAVSRGYRDFRLCAPRGS